MNERDEFVRLLAASLQGVLSLDLSPNARPVQIAVRHAAEAMEAVRQRYADNRRDGIATDQREFARRIEEENGHNHNERCIS